MAEEVSTSLANSSPKPTHVLVRWIFLRALGVVYFIAFASVFVQVLGLIGSQGILPADAFLKQASSSLGAVPFFFCPTLFWLDCSDAALRLLPAFGMVYSLLIVAGVSIGPSLFLCWLLYLSIVTVGGDFMSFQWDVLLLEVGFLSIFFAHSKLLDMPGKSNPLPMPSNVVLWLLRLLLFKLMLSSGCVKLLSGDLAWHDLTALDYHYWTQPLPTPLGWLAAKLPHWFQKFSVGTMFFIELLVPFFIFIPGKFRYGAAALTVFLQLIILLTGNYTFFNLLTILLCVLLLDDAVIQRLLPKRLVDQFLSSTMPSPHGLYSRIKLSALAGLIALLSIGHLTESAPQSVKSVSYALSPWCLVNGYGLFAVMTTSRKEIEVEGSEDGKAWKPYAFFFKPGDLKRAPPWVAPYQPRLDWQMWFAALGSRRDSPWFSHFVLRLLQGSPDVLALLEKPPFQSSKPKFVRASLYEYEFTDWQELQTTGAWWKRTYVGPFFPEASLRPVFEEKQFRPGKFSGGLTEDGGI